MGLCWARCVWKSLYDKRWPVTSLPCAPLTPARHAQWEVEDAGWRMRDGREAQVLVSFRGEDRLVSKSSPTSSACSLLVGSPCSHVVKLVVADRHGGDNYRWEFVGFKMLHREWMAGTKGEKEISVHVMGTPSIKIVITNKITPLPQSCLQRKKNVNTQT